MKPIILTILDGWGIGEPEKTNPIHLAKILNFKKIEQFYPFCSLQASGEAVGLPWKEAGNSEVGHLTIGGGRTVYQYLPRISMDIENETFFTNPAFVKTIEHVKKHNSTLHLMGLISSGNVHSYLEHVYALLELARRNNVDNLRLHLFTDGKDAPLKEGIKIVSSLEQKLKNPNWKIASIIGRNYAMDRNQNWDRTEMAYNLIVDGIGEKTFNPIERIREYYDQDIVDTYIKPVVITDDDQNPIGIVKNNDAIIYWDFREDSARQLTEAFVKKDFNKFNRKPIDNLLFCAMTEYEKGLPIEIAYLPKKIANHLTEILNQYNKKVLKIAETEKYAHVTYFFNGNQEDPFPNETRKLITSNVVTHYDETPEMQAEKITETILEGIKENYDLIIANYANADMIGHTGNLKAGIEAVEAIDKALESLIKLAERGECILIITADHGNIEQMVSLRTGELKTEHTLNPVPFYLVGKEFKKPAANLRMQAGWGAPQGMLSDIAPTILALMQIPQPPEMTGKSLLDVLK